MIKYFVSFNIKSNRNILVVCWTLTTDYLISLCHLSSNKTLKFECNLCVKWAMYVDNVVQQDDGTVYMYIYTVYLIKIFCEINSRIQNAANTDGQNILYEPAVIQFCCMMSHGFHDSYDRRDSVGRVTIPHSYIHSYNCICVTTVTSVNLQ